jgi:hypothetical protein
MEHVLNKVVYEAGRLLRADETRFAGSDGFVTCVALTFERLTAHISAVADDDTVVVSLDPPFKNTDCVTAEVAQQSPGATAGLSSSDCGIQPKNGQTVNYAPTLAAGFSLL